MGSVCGSAAKNAFFFMCVPPLTASLSILQRMIYFVKFFATVKEKPHRRGTAGAWLRMLAIQQRRRAGRAFKGADKGAAAVKTAALGDVLNGEVGIG